MGRVLDTLRQGEAMRGTPLGRVTQPGGEACVVEWTLDEGEVPYIEVGAPGKKPEMSPSLVKHPPQPKVQPPHAPKGAGVLLTEAAPLAVSYEPWPLATETWSVATEVIAYHQPEHPVSKDYAALCDRMLASAPTSGTQVLLLVGVRPSVGTTTALLNLAVTAARGTTRKVALLDAHWSRPALAARLGQAASAGAQDVLAGRLALDQAVLSTPIASLSVCPAGTGDAVGAESLAWVVAWLRQRYDVVLIDGPSLDEAPALAALAPSCDGIYLVLAHGDSPQDRARLQSVPRLGGRLRGLIHTRFEA